MHTILHAILKRTLPRSAELSPDLRLDVIFDGNCRFCVRSLTVVRRLARRDVFRFHDANRRMAMLSRFPMLANADLDEAMFTVSPSGEVARGFFAFRRMLRGSPWLYPFLILFYAPGASIAGPAIYAWVARHRRQLGCASSCDLEDSTSEPGRRQ